MSRGAGPTQPTGRLAASACALALLAASAASAAGPAFATDDRGGVPVTVTVPEAAGPKQPAQGAIRNAEFRWGVNTESGSGAFAGGCNFLSAGTAGNAGSARVWSEADGLYSARSGAVQIVKADANGEWAPASFASKCLDRTGNPVSVSSLTNHTETQAVISGGVGRADATGVEIRWTGSVTVAMYGGMTYWTASDPRLTLDPAGNGHVTATLSGYATDRDDLGAWMPIPPREAVIAEFRPAGLTAKGFTSVPEYLGRTAAVPGQAPRSPENEPYWGAFPDSFLQFQELTGQTGYWMTTNGQRDRAKVPTALTVSFDAADPVAVPTGPAPSPGAGGGVLNPVTHRALAAAGAGGGAAASAALTPPGMQLPWTSPDAISRDTGGGLIPVANGAIPAVVLPAAVTLLALIVSILAAMRLSGIPLFPWRRRTA